MEAHEKDIHDIIKDYILLCERIEKWQKSIPSTAFHKIKTKLFGYFHQFTLTKANPWNGLFFEKLGLCHMRHGGIKKLYTESILCPEFNSLIANPEQGQRMCQNPNCGKSIEHLARTKRYCNDECHIEAYNIKIKARKQPPKEASWEELNV